MNAHTVKYFSIDDQFPPIQGISFGDRWNGFECPYFTKANTKLLLQYLGDDLDAMTSPDSDGTFYYIDGATDKVMEVYYESGQRVEEECKEITPTIVDGVEYFSIGGWNWVWQDEPIEMGSNREKLLALLHEYNSLELSIAINYGAYDRDGNKYVSIEIFSGDVDILDEVEYYDETEAENDLSYFNGFANIATKY